MAKDFSCKEIGHDWESVGFINTERVDGKLYGIVLSECLNCGEEMTWMSDEFSFSEVEEEKEVW